LSAALILVGEWSSAAATEPRHVLLLHSFEPDFAPYDAFAGIFRTELSRRSPAPVDLVEFSMQPARFIRSPDEDAFVNYLRATLAGRRLDLVVSIGGPAAIFAQKHRQQLFPTTPLVLAAVDQRFVQDGTLTPNDTAVAVGNNPTQLIESILGLLPDTTGVFVVIGTSELEQFWRDEVDRASQPFKDRVTLIAIYNRERPHDSLGRVPPLTFLPRPLSAEKSPMELSA
jgi:hypothetical protein